MNAYPIYFHARARSAAGIANGWNVESGTNEIRCAIPPEFDGPGGGLSPEDLFAQALTNCFLATFKVYAEKSKAKFETVEVKSELVVAPGENRKPVMESCKLIAEIKGCENVDRICALAQRAFDSGFILNSVKTKLSLELSAS